MSDTIKINTVTAILSFIQLQKEIHKKTKTHLGNTKPELLKDDVDDTTLDNLDEPIGRTYDLYSEASEYEDIPTAIEDIDISHIDGLVKEYIEYIQEYLPKPVCMVLNENVSDPVMNLTQKIYHICELHLIFIETSDMSEEDKTFLSNNVKEIMALYNKPLFSIAELYEMEEKKKDEPTYRDSGTYGHNPPTNDLGGDTYDTLYSSHHSGGSYREDPLESVQHNLLGSTYEPLNASQNSWMDGDNGSVQQGSFHAPSESEAASSAPSVEDDDISEDQSLAHSSTSTVSSTSTIEYDPYHDTIDMEIDQGSAHQNHVQNSGDHKRGIYFGRGLPPNKTHLINCSNLQRFPKILGCDIM